MASAPLPNDIACGVYWPWETTSHLDNATRADKLPPFLVERLDDLAAHGVNTIWTTNGPDSTEELALLCRLAEARGIRIVAGGGWWAMQQHNHTDAAADEMVAHVKKVWTTLEGKPRPFAFTIADEPRTAYMDVFARYASKVAAAGIPATTVAMWGDYPAAITQATTLPLICQDNYPFFNSTYGPRGDVSYRWFTTNVGAFVRRADAAGMIPWAMPQAYQEIWGPGKLDADGQAIVLPGGGNHWLMPTPAQIRWQTWASVATGAKGVIFFAYAVTSKLNRQAKLLTEGWAYQQETRTGGPLALVSWPEFAPGPQYRALGLAFREVNGLRKVLPDLRAEPDQKTWVRLTESSLDETPWVRLTESSLLAGDLVTLLRHRETGEQFLAVVASPKEGNRTLQLQVHPDILRLQPLAGAPYPVPFTADVAPYSLVTVTLEPGQGGLYRIIRRNSLVDKMLVAEDYSSAEYARRAVEVSNVAPEGEAGKPRVLRATRGEPEVPGQEFPVCACFVTYDLQALVPGAAAPGVMRTFEYDGFGGPGDRGLGVYIWAGPTLDALKPVSSSMAPKKVFPLTPEMRFIKIGISYRQASASYAGLRSWRVVEWQPGRNKQ